MFSLIIIIFAWCWMMNMFTWGLEMKWFVYLKDKYLDYKLFNCTKCFSFWFTLIVMLFINITWAFPIALFISMLSTIIEKFTF